MDPVAIFLLSLAGIFIIGAVGEIIFQRTNIPDVIWLIVAGIVLGPATGLLTRDMLGRIAPFFAAVTLVVVLFEGGSKLKLDELARAAPRSSILALLNFVFAVVAVAGFSMLAALVGWLPGWSFTHGLLLGVIVGGSSSIIIMPAMAQARLEPKIANLVNLESALTDAFCVVGTAAIIDVMMRGSGGAAGPLVTLLKSFGIGLAIGGVAGLVWLLRLRFLNESEHAYPVTLSALMLLYVLIDRLQGSAALGILTVAILMGNAKAITVKLGLKEPVEMTGDVRGFHGQMAFFVKSFFFVFIGAMLGPPWSLLALGVMLGVVLLFARAPGVMLSTIGMGFTSADRKMIGVALPRGMAAGVLATLPVTANVPGTEGVPVVVFACVLTTILTFAVGFPIVRRQMTPVSADGPPSVIPLPAGAAMPSDVPPPTEQSAPPLPAQPAPPLQQAYAPQQQAYAPQPPAPTIASHPDDPTPRDPTPGDDGPQER